MLLISTNDYSLQGFIKFYFLDDVQAKPWCTELFKIKRHSLAWFHIYEPAILELVQISNRISMCYI